MIQIDEHIFQMAWNHQLISDVWTQFHLWWSTWRAKRMAYMKRRTPGTSRGFPRVGLDRLSRWFRTWQRRYMPSGPRERPNAGWKLHRELSDIVQLVSSYIDMSETKALELELSGPDEKGILSFCSAREMRFVRNLSKILVSELMMIWCDIDIWCPSVSKVGFENALLETNISLSRIFEAMIFLFPQHGIW